MMILFSSDYTEGAAPRIMERLAETNLVQTQGYGEDNYCAEAARLIRERCQSPDALVRFLVGGTQTNMTVIASALRPYQAVVTVPSGHINVHETGAVESTGHKILTVPAHDGKLSAEQVLQIWQEHFTSPTQIHAVQPKLVYISSPTELGTIYTRVELEALHHVCHEKGMYLFLDGARLGYGLAASDNDLDLPEITKCCDVFYIGGTKQGALFGEAVVIINEELKNDFLYMIKQKGGLLAKGRLLGIQFQALFEDNLYFELAHHADLLADRLRSIFKKAGCKFLIETTTNQVFPILSMELQKRLAANYGFENWQEIDNQQSAVRFCTSWATKETDIDQFEQDFEALKKSL